MTTENTADTATPAKKAAPAKKERDVRVIIINIALVAVFLFLVCTGFHLIYVSRNAYEDSLKTTAACYTCIKEGYADALLYFSLALATLLLIAFLPRLQSITVGSVSIVLKDIQQQVENLTEQNNLLQERSADIGGGKTLTNVPALRSQVKEEVKQAFKIKYPDDPQKGRWGGLSENNNRRIVADVQKTALPGLYKVVIRVFSTSTTSPLTGLVKFHLHDTFRNQSPVIAVQNNEAVLTLSMVYGAFTVGAEADNGKTKLELDLALDESFPEEFRKR